jgi:DNA repair protein RecO (recombination protein O)
MVILSLVKCNGVVIKTLDYKENDKLVWLYTDNYGKITTVARGAKKSKNKLFLLLYLYVTVNIWYLGGKHCIIYKRGK